MPKIILEHVTKRFDNFYAVDDLNLVMDDNSFVTLLGPSGCGKTTTLRMIAGLETPTSGKITIGNNVVFDSDRGINIPASKRKVGFLFQNYALWPNMTVYKNISFGLKNVKEVMPVYDEETKTNDKFIDVLKHYKDLVNAIEDCKDKKGKIDENRALIRIIDTFEVSMYTAKELYGLKLTKDDQDKVNELVKHYVDRNSEIKKQNTEKGLTTNEKYELLKNGKVVEKNRKLTKEEIELAIRRCARVVKIGEFMDRYPSELSGGQQQRVAIARTLAPNPHVLFMDEPLSNLDAKLRLEMRGELQRLHASTGATFVYVTHDQLEAMTLATKICLINNGVLQQYDAPLDVYSRPNNLFVADFVGNPAMNFIEAKGKQNADGSIDFSFFKKEHCKFVPNKKINLDEYHAAEKATIEADKVSLEAKKNEKGYIEKHNKDLTFKYHIPMVNESVIDEDVEITDEDYVIGVRPEFVKYGKEGSLSGLIYSAMPTGMETTVRIDIDGYLITGVMFGGAIFHLDDKIKVDFIGNSLLIFSRKTGKLICDGKIK